MKSTVALALTLVLLAGGIGSADDGAKPSGPKLDAVRAARLAALKARATEWLDARKAVVGNCPKCGGSGQLVTVRFRVIYRDTCNTCAGLGKIISPKRWQKVKYDFMTPAKRLTMKLEELIAQIKDTKATGPDTGYIKSWRIDRVELVGDHLARAFVFEGKDTIARESRWIEAQDPVAKAPIWFLYSEDTDGPWSDAPAEASVPGDPVPKVETLTVDELDALRTKVGLAKSHQGLESAQLADELLSVQVFDGGAKNVEDLDAHLSDDVVPVTRAAFQAIAAVKTVRVVFMARWKDKFGAVAKKPYKSSEIRREDFDKIHFENLTKDEVLALFSMKETLPPGEVMWWKADKSPEGDDPK